MKRALNILIKGVAALLPVTGSYAFSEGRAISTLGRIEPLNSVLKLASPSGNGLGGAVIKEMLVVEGDWVYKDQILARLDSHNVRKADVARLKAVLTNRNRKLARQKPKPSLWLRSSN